MRRAALVGRAGKFPRVVLGPVVKTEGGDHLLRGGHVVQDGDRVQPAGEQDHDLHGKKGLRAFS